MSEQNKNDINNQKESENSGIKLHDMTKQKEKENGAVNETAEEDRKNLQKSEEEKSIVLLSSKEKNEELQPFNFDDLNNVTIYAKNQEEANKLKPLAEELDSFMKEVGSMDDKDSQKFREYFKKELQKAGIDVKEENGVLTINVKEDEINKITEITRKCKEQAKTRVLPDEIKKYDDKENLMVLFGPKEQNETFKEFVWDPGNDQMISVKDKKENGNAKRRVEPNVRVYAKDQDEADKFKPAVPELSPFIENLKKAQEEGLGDEAKKLRERFQEELKEAGIEVKKTETGTLMICVKRDEDITKLQKIAGEYKEHAKTLINERKLPSKIQASIAVEESNSKKEEIVVNPKNRTVKNDLGK